MGTRIPFDAVPAASDDRRMRTARSAYPLKNASLAGRTRKIRILEIFFPHEENFLTKAERPMKVTENRVRFSARPFFR